MLTISVKGIDNAGEDFSGTIAPEMLNLNDGSTEGIRFLAPLNYALHASEVSGGLLVAGSISVKISAECDRCLEKFEYDLILEDVCHFIENVSSDIVDISDDLREDVLIALPAKQICREDCAGLCHTCGTNLNKERCSCATSTGEFQPRSPWDALAQLNTKSGS